MSILSLLLKYENFNPVNGLKQKIFLIFANVFLLFAKNACKNEENVLKKFRFSENFSGKTISVTTSCENKKI
jgi:hypothetical protein